MSEIVKLTTRNKTSLRDRALVLLLQGDLVVVAAEHGYMYICDAFNQVAVNRLHTLRGDAQGIAAQVLIGKASAVSGLAQDFDSEWQLLADSFWPGLLTMQLKPQQALRWDLGDGGALAEFAVRIPDRDFLRSLLTHSGPLAAASVSLAGNPPTFDINFVPAMPSEVGLFVDEGILTKGPVSTVLRRSVASLGGGIEVLRKGAVSLTALKKVLPTISLPKP